ncbi:MAG: hypothetical protein HQK50_07650 [Oligoflexia bacterium]|nr:hypothetical protein [Oligoflexia bacterium]MBF0365430.1 hypothetical protein [Oligoflexia bacterium]
MKMKSHEGKKFIKGFFQQATSKIRSFRDSVLEKQATQETLKIEELDPQKLEVLSTMADFIVKREMETVAVLFLESLRPLQYLGSQAMIFFEPFLTIFVDPTKVTLFREAMEDKRYFEYLIERLEGKHGDPS